MGSQEIKDTPQDLLKELALAQPEVKIEDAPVKTFFRGAARGALGPFLDLYYRATGQENIVKAQDELSPVAEGAGHLAGLIGGAVASGGTGTAAKLAGRFTVGGLSAKAGAAATKLGAAKLGAAAETLGGKLALGALGGAAEAGAAGLAEGSSAAALDRESGLPGVARHVAEGVGYGMALGGSLGLLGTAFYRTNNWLFKKAWGDAIKEAGNAQKSRLADNLKLDALKAEHDSLMKTIDAPPEYLHSARGVGRTEFEGALDSMALPELDAVAAKFPRDAKFKQLQNLSDKFGMSVDDVTTALQSVEDPLQKVEPRVLFERAKKRGVLPKEVTFSDWRAYKTFGDKLKGSRLSDIESYYQGNVTTPRAIDESIFPTSTVSPDYTNRVTNAYVRLDEILGFGPAAREKPIRGLNPAEGSEMVATQRRVEKADEIIRKLTDNAARSMGKNAQAIARDLIFTAPGLFAGGPFSGMGALVFRKFLPEYTTAIADTLLGGLEKFPAIRRVLGQSIKAGELTLDKIQKSGDDLVRVKAGHQLVGGQEVRTQGFKLSNLDTYIFELRNAGKAMKVVPLHYMTSDDYNDIVNEFQNTDLGQYEWQQRLALMGSGLPQEVVNGHIEHMIRVQQYIKGNLPTARGDRFITPLGDRLVSTDAERIALARRIRAAMIPETVVNDFLNNRLTPEAAEAFYVTQPYAAKELSEEVTRLTDIARTQGVRISPSRMRQIALVTNNPTKSGRTYDPALIQQLQANYQPKQQAMPQGSPQLPKLDGVQQSAMSSADALAARLAGPR